MNRSSLLLIGCGLLAACARTEPADQSSSDPMVAPALTAEEQARADDPTTPGSWEASAQGESQAVIYRGPEGETLFTIACDLRGGLVVQRPGLVARGNLALMQLRSADVVRRLAVNASSGPGPLVEARVPYNDQLIPTLLSFDETLEVRYEGLDALTLPPNPLVGDLVRTCQQSSNAPVANPGAAPPQAQDPAPAQPAQPAPAQPAQAQPAPAQPARQ